MKIEHIAVCHHFECTFLILAFWRLHHFYSLTTLPTLMHGYNWVALVYNFTPVNVPVVNGNFLHNNFILSIKSFVPQIKINVFCNKYCITKCLTHNSNYMMHTCYAVTNYTHHKISVSNVSWFKGLARRDILIYLLANIYNSGATFLQMKLKRNKLWVAASKNMLNKNVWAYNTDVMISLSCNFFFRWFAYWKHWKKIKSKSPRLWASNY